MAKVDSPQSNISFQPDDVFIVVTGITGHGKSSFISKCCDDQVDIVGHSLFSHTNKCNIYSFTHNGKTIRLVDTPGFDDSKRTGTEILREIAEWLVYAYKQGVRLSGIVYLHSISENRIRGSGMMNLEMFKKITGLDNMNQVVLATTMWNCTPEADAKRREMELLQTDEFWGALVMNHKSHPSRFLNDKTSALTIIDRIASLPKFVPSLQREVAVDNKALNETAAGQTLNKELVEAQKKSKREMEQMQEELEKAIHDKDLELATKVMDMQTKLNQQMEQLTQNQKDMQVKSEELLKKKEEEIRKTRAEMAEMQKAMQDRDQKHEADVAQIKEENKRKDQEMQKVMDDLSKRHEANMENFKDSMVNSAAYLVAEMDSYYNNMAKAQQKKMEDTLADMKSHNAGSPPPYWAVPPQSPQTIYVQPATTRDPYEGAMKSAAGGAAAAGSLAVMAGLGGCSVM